MRSFFKAFFKDIKFDFFLFALIIFSVVGCIFFIQHRPCILFDLGRELLFPQLVLQNEVLYKDIFNLFGPFSYLLNALICRIFGSGFDTFYYLGYVTSLSVVIGIYYLAKEFFDKPTAFVIGLFTISIGITTTYNFNYYFPYAYAILYGFIFFIWSVYFYIRYAKTQQFYQLGLSMLFAGIAVANKYEYIFYTVFIFILAALKFFKYKKIQLYQFLMGISWLILPSLLCFLYLMYQGLLLNDFIKALVMVRQIILTDGYIYFYTIIGTFFSQENIQCFISSFAEVFTLIGLLYLAGILFSYKKVFGIIAYIIAIYKFDPSKIQFYYQSYDLVICFLPILILILFIVCYRELADKNKFLIFSVIVTSYKVLWLCRIKYYGVFFAPVLLVALFIFINDKKRIKNIALLCLMVLIPVIINVNINDRMFASFEIFDKNKSIYTDKPLSYKINRLNSYIIKHTKKNDKVVVYPEGIIVNYLTGRPAENIYYALTPPYLELFGETNIIDYYSKNKPEYFIITEDDMSAYGKNTICKDYAKSFCKFVKENYIEKEKFSHNKNDKIIYHIYKRK